MYSITHCGFAAAKALTCEDVIVSFIKKWPRRENSAAAVATPALELPYLDDDVSKQVDLQLMRSTNALLLPPITRSSTLTFYYETLMSDAS